MNLQVYEEASEWLVRNRNGGLEAREKIAFDAWLRQSPVHVRAYLEMSTVWENVASLDACSTGDASELITRARADENIVPLTSPSSRAVDLGREPSRPEVLAVISSAGEASSSRGDRRPDAARAVTVRTDRSVRSRVYAIAACLLLALVGVWFYALRNTYATDIGEQRSLTLADGSVVELNSRSRVRIRYTESEREVDLLEGQALFRVARNPLRPFVVQTDSTRVRAVGTQFDVYRKRAGTVVTVVEGKVAVLPNAYAGTSAPPRTARPETPADARAVAGCATPRRAATVAASGNGPASTPQAHPSEASCARESGSGPNAGAALAEPTAQWSNEAASSGAGNADDTARPRGVTSLAGGEVLLVAGEQLTVTPTALAAPRRANIAAATAWTQRRVIFEASPLTEVAEEFNRYNTRKIVIQDPQLTNFHVSGVFSSADPALLLQFLRTQPELIVEESGKEIYIVRR